MLKVVTVLFLIYLCWFDPVNGKSKPKLRQKYINPKYLFNFHAQPSHAHYQKVYLKVGCEAAFTNKTDPFAKIEIKNVIPGPDKQPFKLPKTVTIGSLVSYYFLCLNQDKTKVETVWFDKRVGADKNQNCRWKESIGPFSLPNYHRNDPRVRNYLLYFQSISLPKYYLSINYTTNGSYEIMQPKEFIKIKNTDHEKQRIAGFHDAI